MKDKHAGCTRGFTHYSEAWYSKTSGPMADGTADEIMIGMYDLEGGGTTGEFGVRWIVLNDRDDPSPRLEVFNDAWDALSRFGDLLQVMASIDSRRVSPREFADILRALGIKDLTIRHRPTSTPADIEYASWMPALQVTE